MFIRYFEDRGILSPDHMEDLTGHPRLIELLRAGPKATYKLFSSLGDRFDGDLFSDVMDTEARLDAGDLAALSEFLGATDMTSGQRAFWPYDFSVIPPELISSIYEQLLEETQEQDAAHYTPRHIVDLILDEVLPWNGAGTPKILDPACGSGIFLAEAFRRLVFREGGDQSFKSLSELLTQSVFGVDQSAAAITVTAFGLYLAMLEELDPPTVWRDARLPKLVDENLVIADFFDDAVFAELRFDIVVGNPPWTSQFTEPATRFINSRQRPIADKQLATAFLWKSADMLAEQGTLGMLLPAKQLLHNKSDSALHVRRTIIHSLEIDTIIDLSIIRRELFQSAVAPAAVLIARAKGADDHQVTHVVPRNTPLQRAIDGFVVSQKTYTRYQRKRLPPTAISGRSICGVQTKTSRSSLDCEPHFQQLTRSRRSEAGYTGRASKLGRGATTPRNCSGCASSNPTLSIHLESLKPSRELSNTLQCVASLWAHIRRLTF